MVHALKRHPHQHQPQPPTTNPQGQLYTQEADGVAGLGFGPSALPFQLAAAHSSRQPGGRPPAAGGPPGAFALCFGQTGGAMAIGAAPKVAGGPAMQYVSLMPSAKGYYNVPVADMLVEGRALQGDKVGL